MRTIAVTRRGELVLRIQFEPTDGRIEVTNYEGEGRIPDPETLLAVLVKLAAHAYEDARLAIDIGPRSSSSIFGAPAPAAAGETRSSRRAISHRQTGATRLGAAHDEARTDGEAVKPRAVRTG